MTFVGQNRMDRNRPKKKFILVCDAVTFEISGNGRIM